MESSTYGNVAVVLASSKHPKAGSKDSEIDNWTPCNVSFTLSAHTIYHDGKVI